MAAHTNVCVIGLGSMGMGAARACLQAGLNTWGVDINPDNCRALLAASHIATSRRMVIWDTPRISVSSLMLTAPRCSTRAKIR
ncbi:YgbJ [Klebsiella pneumoniae]|nr:YgbJ [Klebsiella pneumoniae]